MFYFFVTKASPRSSGAIKLPLRPCEKSIHALMMLPIFLSNQFFCRNFFKCLLKICFNIVYVLNAHADANLVGLHSGRDLFCFAELFMSSRCGVNHQSFCIANVCQMAGEL